MSTSCQNCYHQNSFMVVIQKFVEVVSSCYQDMRYVRACRLGKVVKKGSVTVTTLTTQMWSILTTFWQLIDNLVFFVYFFPLEILMMLQCCVVVCLSLSAVRKSHDHFYLSCDNWLWSCDLCVFTISFLNNSWPVTCLYGEDKCQFRSNFRKVKKVRNLLFIVLHNKPHSLVARGLNPKQEYLFLF